MKKILKAAVMVMCTLAMLMMPFSVTAGPVGGGQASPSAQIKAYGCDMSFWNVGGYYPDYSRVDFNRLKAAGCDFVILRVGFEGTGTRQNTIDDAFLTLYYAAKEAGLGVGVYFYALATTYEGAVEDATWCIDLFKKYNMSFEYPIYYDVEDPGNGADRPGHEALTDSEMTTLCLGWAQTLEAAGYYPGTYGTYDVLSKLQPAYTNEYDVWYAYVAYTAGIPEFIPEEQDHSAFCGMWQYSWKGLIDGVTGDLDVNVAYKDYPSIMKRNGYNNVPISWEISTSLLPDVYGFHPNPFNANGEGVVATFDKWSVTLKSSVDSTWAWPSAYMACNRVVDIAKYPMVRFVKNGTAHFNAVVSYEAPDGTYKTANLATIAGEATGEFDSGDMTITVDFGAYLRREGHLPVDGLLKISGVTYYIMGAKGTYVTLTEAYFAPAPVPETLTSSQYMIDADYVVGVCAPITASEFIAGFDNVNGVVVRDKNGMALSEEDEVASSMTVCIEQNGVLIKSYVISLLGDVNADGEATTMDARVILGTVVGVAKLNDWQQRSADFDQNGEFSTADVRGILTAIVK